jgi:hypothetical protein
MPVVNAGCAWLHSVDLEPSGTHVKQSVHANTGRGRTFTCAQQACIAQPHKNACTQTRRCLAPTCANSKATVLGPQAARRCRAWRMVCSSQQEKHGQLCALAQQTSQASQDAFLTIVSSSCGCTTLPPTPHNPHTPKQTHTWFPLLTPPPQTSLPLLAPSPFPLSSPAPPGP